MAVLLWMLEFFLQPSLLEAGSPAPSDTTGPSFVGATGASSVTGALGAQPWALSLAKSTVRSKAVAENIGFPFFPPSNL